MVVRGQVRRQSVTVVSVTAPSPSSSKCRESSGGPRGLDSPVRRMLRQMQHLRAVGEERRAALAQIQPALVELREQRDQADRRFALACGRDLDFCKELEVRELRYRVD